jgi:hypothetical protein
MFRLVIQLTVLVFFASFNHFWLILSEKSPGILSKKLIYRYAKSKQKIVKKIELF